MRRLLTAISRLTRTDLAFIHFKAALSLLLMIPLVQATTVQNTTNLMFVAAWFGMTLLGFCVSVVGIVLSAQDGTIRRTGFRVEMAGLWLLLSGPLVFGLIQVGRWWTTGQPVTVTVALCYVIASAILARMVMIKSAAKSRTVIFRYTESVDDD